MTPAQFAALAALLRLRQGPAQECARLVLVEGLRQAQAARQTGLSRQAACSAISRCSRGLALVRQVTAN